MKHIRTATARGKLFKPLLNTTSVQAAMMTLAPGKSSSDEPVDEHPKAEQWLFVVSGSGVAIGKSSRIAIREGSLLLIQKNEPHQIKNTGRKPLVTINFYSPPAYTDDAEVRPAVK
jgi:mannose-6-phosphate isomerase-like protein (cupin superfamily)